MLEVLDQVYENVLREEVQHALAPRDPFYAEVHVQVPKENGVPEELQGLLKVSQLFQRQRLQVRSDERDLSDSGDYLASYQVWPVVAR